MSGVRQVALSCGPIDYVDTGGDGPAVMLLHGLAMDHSLWREVIARLPGYRCIAPTLPEGAHRHPVRADFELTPLHVSTLIGELIDALGLRDVVLVENDSGRAQEFAAANPTRLAGLVLVACEAFENYPPGLPGKLVGRFAMLPGGVWAIAQLARIRPLLNTRLFLGQMSVGGVPRDLLDRWVGPLTRDPRIRRDFSRYCRASMRHEMMTPLAGLSHFPKPALIVWTTDGLVMPRKHGRRFLRVFPDATLVEIEESRALVPIDQPARLADAIRGFVEGLGRRA